MRTHQSALKSNSILAGLIVLALFSSSSYANPYSFTQLQTLGGSFSSARGINNSNQIVGYSETITGSGHAVLWQGNTIQDIHPNNYNYSSASSINNNGQIAGAAESTSNYGAAFWSSDFSFVDISQGLNGQGHGINDLGQVTGNIYTNGYGGFLSQNNNLTPLSSSESYVLTGNDISNTGAIVGFGFPLNPTTGAPINNYYSATVSNGDKVKFLEAIGGAGSNSYAYGINELGQVVGASEYNGVFGQNHATLWDGDNVTDLGTIGGGSSYANAINERGQVVGGSNGRAFMWQNGVITDLNSLVNLSLGLFLTDATDINDFGWIVGTLYDSNTETEYGFLLTPSTPSAVPLPTAAWFFASALGGFGLLKRRKSLM